MLVEATESSGEMVCMLRPYFHRARRNATSMIGRRSVRPSHGPR